MSKSLYVNPAWSGKNYAPGTDLGNGMFWGENAFGFFGEAYAAADANDSVTLFGTSTLPGGEKNIGVTLAGKSCSVTGSITLSDIGTSPGARNITVKEGAVLQLGKAPTTREAWLGGSGSAGEVGNIWIRAGETSGGTPGSLTVAAGGSLLSYGQISNRGQIVVRGEMKIGAVEGSGSMALAGVASAPGSFTLDGGNFSDIPSLWTNANDLKPVNSLTVGENSSGGVSVMKIINDADFSTTGSWMTVYEKGVLIVEDSSFEMRYPENNTGIGILWENVKPESVFVNKGSVTIDDSELFLTNVVNTGVITVKGSSTVNALITGEGSVTLANGTLLGGELDSSITVSGTASLKDDAVFSGRLLGGSLKVAGSNLLNIASGSSAATLLLAAGTYTDDLFGDAVLKGSGKNTFITVNASSFNGNRVSNLQLAVTGATVDGGISILIDDPARIKSINGNAVIYNGNAADRAYYVVMEGKLYELETAGTGISFVPAATAATAGTGVIVNFNGSLDRFSEGMGVFGIEVKEGTANLKVSKGVAVSAGDISKSANGGVTNITVAPGKGTLRTELNAATIEAIGKLVCGNSSDLNVTGAVRGTNFNTAIQLGSFSTGSFGSIDLEGGSNTLSIGSQSRVTVGTESFPGNIANVRTIKLASGIYKKAKNGTITEIKTTLTVNGDMVSPMMNSSVTLGSDARLTAVNLQNNDVNTGTTFKAGLRSELLFSGNVTGFAGVSLGNNSTFRAANAYGTAQNNTFSLGSGAEAVIDGELDFKGGNNTLKLGTGAVLQAENLLNLRSFTAGNRSLIGTAEEEVGCSFGSGNDTLKLGDGVRAFFAAVDLGDGKDTFSIGRGTKVTLTSLAGAESLNGARGSEIWFNNGAEDVDLEGVKGSWKNAEIFDVSGIARSTSGAVYANEWDVYEVTSEVTSLTVTPNGVEVWYSGDNGNSWLAWESGTTAGAGDLIRVGIDFDSKDQYAKATYSISITSA